MRVLYLTNRFPFPLTSGYLRHYHLIKALSARHAVSLLSIVEPDFDDSYKEAMAPFTERILTFTTEIRQSELPRRFISRLRVLTRKDVALQRMGSAVQELMAQEPFDVVISGKRTYIVLNHTAHVPLIADVCDATSMRVRRSMSFAPAARLPRLLLEYKHTRRLERDLLAHAEHALFISERDREAALGRSAVPTSIVPNGIDLDYWQRTTYERDRDTIVFSGVMNYWPNTDAALYLIRHVFPQVQQAVPEAQLLIVGRDPTPELVDAGRRPGVTVTGFVDDIRLYLERATVFAAPLRFGAGVQNKVLEAMAMGVPVIASPVAAEGLYTETGKRPPVQIASNQKQLVQQIIEALKRGVSDPKPDSAARHFLERYFTWDSSSARLEQVLERVVNRVKQ